MKQRAPVILVLLLLLAGLGILGYPSLSAWINSRHQTRAIQEYTELVDALDGEEIDRQWELARQYNRRFSGRAPDSFAGVEIPTDYLDVLNVSESGLMGYIEIPVIGVYLPIYHGAEERVLRRGVGHMPETALPTGGESLHPVLTGHRAMATAELFNDLDQLEEGDVFLLHILDATLAYQVDKITVVEPDHIQDLLPVAGEDNVSLVTCTPYAVNSHRLLVRGSRIPYHPEEPMAIREIETGEIDWQKLIVLCFVLLWLLIGVGCLLSGRRAKYCSATSPRSKQRRSIWPLPCLLALVGIGLLLYPTISRMVYEAQAERDLEEFLREREEFPEPGEETDPLLEALREYNRCLFEGGQELGFQHPLAFEEENTAIQELGYTEETIGYLDIPAMEIVLPVYLGASQENMDRGAAHMTWTSLPIGGENTHACIIAHRNLMRAEMFRNIDRLEVGDNVYVYTQWDDLEYAVVETKVIWPHESEHFIIQPGRDLLTLISCTPRGSSAQRILVICKRTG